MCSSGYVRSQLLHPCHGHCFLISFSHVIAILSKSGKTVRERDKKSRVRLSSFHYVDSPHNANSILLAFFGSLFHLLLILSGVYCQCLYWKVKEMKKENRTCIDFFEGMKGRREQAGVDITDNFCKSCDLHSTNRMSTM
jgi:hypothetical protein